MNLLNLFGARTPGPGWKSQVTRFERLGISLLYLCWCRRPSYYSCQKM
jgi:hypothetical protein